MPRPISRPRSFSRNFTRPRLVRGDFAHHLRPQGRGRWFAELSSGQSASFASIAALEGCSERYVRSVLPLAFLAPDVISAGIDGRFARR
jgi:hypothetical protein